MTLFGGYFYDGLNDAIGVHHTSAKSWGELVTLFGGYSYDGLNAVIWGPTHRGAKSGGHAFWRLLL